MAFRNIALGSSTSSFTRWKFSVWPDNFIKDVYYIYLFVQVSSWTPDLTIRWAVRYLHHSDTQCSGHQTTTTAKAKFERKKNYNVVISAQRIAGQIMCVNVVFNILNNMVKKTLSPSVSLFHSYVSKQSTVLQISKTCSKYAQWRTQIHTLFCSFLTYT